MARMRAPQVRAAEGAFEIVERDVPEPGPGQVRVRVQASGICHSDVLTKEGHWPGWATWGSSSPPAWGTRPSPSRGARTRSRWPRTLGAHHYVDSEAEDPAKRLAELGGARVVLATVTSAKAMTAVLGGLAADGTLLVVGAPPEAIEVPPLLLIGGRRKIAGWPSGTSSDSEDTLAFSARQGVRPMNELYPLEHAAEAYDRMMSGRARFRVVLETGS